MKKRLRKKLRRGEFTEYGFEFAVAAPDDRKQRFVDDLVELVESRQMYVGGGFGRWGSEEPGWFFVTRGSRRSCAESDRSDFQIWLASREDVAPGFVVGPLVDANR